MTIHSRPSKRIEVLKQSFLDAQPRMCCQRAVIYTDAYRRYEAYPVVLKRALAFSATLREIDIFIEDGELLVGHPASRPRSAEVFPEISFRWIGELDDFETREHNRLKVSDEVKHTLREIYPYWEGKTLADRFAVLRPEPQQKAMDCALLSNPHEWSGLAHVSLDYEKILTLGVEGILAQIDREEALRPPTAPDSFEAYGFYRACREILRGMLAFAERYAVLVREKAAHEVDETRRTELERIAQVLTNVPRKPATSFHEALQAFWFVQLLPQIESNGFSISPGRFDQYIDPYYQADLTAGNITPESAQELLDCLFLKFCEILRVDSTKAAEVNAGYASGQNLVVGGLDKNGRDATNDISFMCLTANAHVGLNQPNLTVRLHRNTPADFLAGVVESIANGNGMPQVLNDEVIIPSLLNRGIPLGLARDYLPVGCDEISVKGAWSRCNGGYVNFAKALELTIGKGEDLLYGIPAGLPLDVDTLGGYGQFEEAFCAQLRHAVGLQVAEANLTDMIHRQMMPLPFVSIFVDGCIENGRDVTGGGARINTTGLVGVGAANCGDSLYAIREMVYRRGLLTLPQLRKTLVQDFEGQEYLRQTILNRLPKFGNDNDDVDALVVMATNVFFDELERYVNARGGKFWPALYSVTAQVGLGNGTAAGADGRKSRLPLADGLTPMYGQDRNGPTAALRSLVKVDLVRAPNGVIVNQRLLPSVFSSEAGREKFVQLLRSFVEIGGFHWQFNIIGTEILLDAQKNPDAYRGLVVRVAGYSAIFVELSLKAQNSVIERNAASL